jgi:exodeoxyribonuclease VII small subunit
MAAREVNPEGTPIGNTETQPPPVLDSLTFEEAFSLLNRTAEELEAGGLSLTEATARFEQGMKLVERCNRLLNTAEVKITQLKDSYRDGVSGPAPAAFDEEPEEPDWEE